jgi:hypothetical protein
VGENYIVIVILVGIMFAMEMIVPCGIGWEMAGRVVGRDIAGEKSMPAADKMRKKLEYHRFESNLNDQ